MPSQKPRLNLTLDDEVLETITRLARLLGKSKAGMVNELLVDMMPALVDMANAIEDVQNKKNALPYLARMTAMANQQVGVMNAEMGDLMSNVVDCSHCGKQLGVSDVPVLDALCEDCHD